MYVEYSQEDKVVRVHEGYPAGQNSGNNLKNLYIGNLVRLNSSRIFTTFTASSGGPMCPNCLTDILCCFNQSIIVAYHFLPHSFQFIIYSLSYMEQEQLSMSRLGHGLDGQEIAVRCPTGITDLFFFNESRPALGLPQTPIQFVTMTSQDIRQPGLEADYSPASSPKL